MWFKKNRVLETSIVGVLMFVSFNLLAKMEVDKILIDKKARQMTFEYKGKEQKTYRIALSLANTINPFHQEGPKRLRGDSKTPEGFYKIEKKRKNTNFPLSLLINYPNEADIQWGKENNYSKKELGDLILIHGYPKKPNPKVLAVAKYFGIDEMQTDTWLRENFYPFYDWTDGCVAVTDEEMVEIFESVKAGTPVEIF